MNRIILIGNGFDLAHGLKTKYENFINWYWEQRIIGFVGNTSRVSSDCLCTLKLKDQDYTWSLFHYNYCNRVLNPIPAKEIVEAIFTSEDDIEISQSPLFERITKSIETKGWVDIENEYYQLLLSMLSEREPNLRKLNAELSFVTTKLIEYLGSIQSKVDNNIISESLRKLFFESVHPKDIAIESKNLWNSSLGNKINYNDRTWREILSNYHDEDEIKDLIKEASSFRQKLIRTPIRDIPYEEYPACFFMPDRYLLINFNYTTTADFYMNESEISQINHIHGNLLNPQSVIFGYGDELDENYKKIQNLNNNEYLRNVKSVRYLESDNYRKVLSFVESAPYQIYVMGHSCENSDRTLLNKLFEHKNCVSIKPFYHQYEENGTLKDNYLDLVQNISRNFNDKSLMRDRVVNKTYCEPLPQIRNNQETPQP